MPGVHQGVVLRLVHGNGRHAFRAHLPLPRQTHAMPAFSSDPKLLMVF